MKNIYHCLNYQNENAVPLKQDGFFLKLLEHHHHTSVCTCYAEGGGSITLALSPQPGGKSDYYSHSAKSMHLAEWTTKEKTHQSRATSDQGPRTPLPVPNFCRREEWGGLLWKEGEDRKQKKENPELTCFTSRNNSKHSELGNNPEAGYIPVWVKSSWYVIFDKISEKERKEWITVAVHDSGWPLSSSSLPYQWSASAFYWALRGKGSLIRKEKGQGESPTSHGAKNGQMGYMLWMVKSSQSIYFIHQSYHAFA